MQITITLDDGSVWEEIRRVPVDSTRPGQWLDSTDDVVALDGRGRDRDGVASLREVIDAGLTAEREAGQ